MSSTRKLITKELSQKLETYLTPDNQPSYWSKEVTFDWGMGKGNTKRVDYMAIVPLNNTVSGIEKSDVCCYEVKSSPEDFHSEHGHNFFGDYNYYVMTEATYQKVVNEIPHDIGVLVPCGSALRSIKKTKRRDRQRPLVEILFMMFRSANRDRKVEESHTEPKTLNDLKNILLQH